MIREVPRLSWQLNVAAGFLLTLLSSAALGDALEGLGSELRLSSGALGSVVTPLVTSLPELVVVLYSLIIYGAKGYGVAEGTVIGEPFIISSLMLPALIILATLMRRAPLRGHQSLVQPFAVFVAFFPSVVLPSIIYDLRVKYAVAIFLAVIYALFMMRQANSGGELERVSEPLLSRRLGRAGIAMQLTLSVLGIYFGSELLVQGVLEVSRAVGIQPLEVSILLVPMATALPESGVAFAWELRGHDELAVRAMVGETVLYATVYPALGIIAAPWRLDLPAVEAVIGAEAAALTAALELSRKGLSWRTALVGLGGLALYIAMLSAGAHG